LKSLPFQQSLESLADQVMIIGEQEANGHGIRGSLENSSNHWQSGSFLYFSEVKT
jgi:hypothetical protein